MSGSVYNIHLHQSEDASVVCGSCVTPIAVVDADWLEFDVE
jgi:hypothetical protein